VKTKKFEVCNAKTPREFALLQTNTEKTGNIMGSINSFKVMPVARWTANGRSGLRLYTYPMIQVSAMVGEGYRQEKAFGTGLVLAPGDEILCQKEFMGRTTIVVERLIEDWTTEQVKKTLDILRIVNGYLDQREG